MSPPAVWTQFDQSVEDALARLIAAHERESLTIGYNVLLCEYLAPIIREWLFRSYHRGFDDMLDQVPEIDVEARRIASAAGHGVESALSGGSRGAPQ